MTGELGTVYLLHFDPPYRHAKHYLGWTAKQPEERLAIHLNGKGSPLVRAQLNAGGLVTLVRIWEEVDRDFERHLKNKRNTPRTLCPICRERDHIDRATREIQKDVQRVAQNLVKGS